MALINNNLAVFMQHRVNRVISPIQQTLVGSDVDKLCWFFS